MSISYTPVELVLGFRLCVFLYLCRRLVVEGIMYVGCRFVSLYVRPSVRE